MQYELSQMKSIAIEFLFDGMEVTEDIYNYSGNLLLIAKGSILTTTKILQLRAFNGNNRNILVSADMHKALIDYGTTLSNALTQEHLDEKVGYTAIKEATAVFLDDVEKKHTVKMKDATVISSDISSKLATVDPSLIFQCVNTPSAIDEQLRRHSINVGFINGLMGKWMNLSPAEIDMLVLAGLVHDVGKTKIPREILDAPRRLTISEFEAMKMHTIFSHELLSDDTQFPELVKLAARHHHEKMNGNGYPDGLVADEISLFARITAVSDVYDAMVSKRSYKESNNPFKIIAQLASQQFSELDISLVRLFTANMPSELLGKSVLLSDGSIGIIKFILPEDLEHPLVSINDTTIKMDEDLFCIRMVLN